MDAKQLKPHINSHYAGCCMLLTTQHQKSVALASPFYKILGAPILEYLVDTDQLGTFSGEIERQGNALETAKKKCEWSLKKTNAEYALASEGSFGPHPLNPFIPADLEILYFIDKKLDFHLHVSDLYTETNYQMGDISSYEELMRFAEKALFPSHALIIRPYPKETQNPIFKGILTKTELENAFQEARKLSPDNKVWIETDMRAHVNPTRMRMIGMLGETLAQRLACLCPECLTPGWGIVDAEQGLPCAGCGTATEEIKAEIFGCAKCKYQEILGPADDKQQAKPGQCSYCNP